MTLTLTGMINTTRADEADKSASSGTPRLASNFACRRIDRPSTAGTTRKRFLSLALYSAYQLVQLRRIDMISKLNTSGLMAIVAAGLAIGVTSKSVTHVDKAFDSIGRSEYPGMLTQYGQHHAYPNPERYSVSIDPAAKQHLGEQTYNEVTMFYQTTQRAIETKNTEVLMSQYSDNYRNGDLDKVSVAHAWQKIFAKVDDLTSVNNMTLVSVSADRNMVVLQSSGLLAGVPDGKQWPVTVDNWNKQDHILIKEAGDWKLIGIYGQKHKRLWFDKPMHPLI